MSHKLQDITLYYPDSQNSEQTKTFSGRSHVVTDLYVHFLNSYKPPKTSRVSVELGSNNDNMFYFGSILRLYHPFNKDQFWELSEAEKKRKILEMTHEVALRCCNNYNWELEVFELAYKKVLDVDFKYEIELKKKLSPNRKQKACLVLEKDERCAIISALFLNLENERTNKVELFRLPQHEMFYGSIIKKARWFGNNFGISQCEGELRITGNAELSNRTVEYLPNKYTQDRLERSLNQLTCPEINSKEEYEAWMKGELSTTNADE
jgi:hypothetical protein